MLYIGLAILVIVFIACITSFAFGIYEYIIEDKQDRKVLEETKKKLHIRHLENVNHVNK